MSKRIANLYNNFLEYEKRVSSSNKSPQTSLSKGLLARRPTPQSGGRNSASRNSGKMSELSKVADYIANVRAYRNS